MIEKIMAKEEEHADDMKKILDNLSEKLRPEKSSKEERKAERA